MADITDKDLSKDFLTTTQAARLLCVSPDTVLKWVKAGKIRSYRTLGGHFRIPLSELDVPEAPGEVETNGSPAGRPLVHQYCWEYLAAGGPVKEECKECITYRSRARRCYELKDLPGGMGCLNLLCDTDCDDCDYYKVVKGQGINVLVLSRGSALISDLDVDQDLDGLHLQFAENEYQAAMKIQSFRPDYVVVDCAFGKQRTASICSSLFSDIRIPVARIILSSKSHQIQDYCDKEVFGWIKKPFAIEQLKSCIRGVPKMVD